MNSIQKLGKIRMRRDPKMAGADYKEKKGSLAKINVEATESWDRMIGTSTI